MYNTVSLHNRDSGYYEKCIKHIFYLRKDDVKMIKKVAILANGGDVSGFNAVIRAIIKTAENN